MSLVDIKGEVARQWLKLPSNPNGKTNNDVLRPILNGSDVVKRSHDSWIIDFGCTEADASLYEAPFEYLLGYVKPDREKNNREAYRQVLVAARRSASGYEASAQETDPIHCLLRRFQT